MGCFSLLALIPLHTHSSIHPPGSLSLLIISHLPIALVGLLSGLELPHLSDLNDDRDNAFSETLGIDYLGSLVGTVVYALYLYPEFGLITSAITIGLLNFVAAVLFYIFNKEIRNWKRTIIVTGLVGVFTFTIAKLEKVEEETYRTYYGKTIRDKYWSNQVPVAAVNVSEYYRTQYQDIIFYDLELDSEFHLTDSCMNLDGHVQMCDSWVDHYHQSLIHVPMIFQPDDKEISVLLIGGGDWIPMRYLSDYKIQLTHVDLDKKFTDLAKKHPKLRKHHQQAYKLPSLTTYYEDGFAFLKNNKTAYDLIVFDLPGVHHDKLMHFYSVEFYSFVKRSLSDEGIAVVWAYDKKNHNDHYEIMMNTISEAGFNSMTTYFSIIDDRYESDPFYLLSKNGPKGIQQNNLPYYVKNKEMLDKRLQWQAIPSFEGIKPNSVFSPNYDLIIEPKKRFHHLKTHKA